MSKIDDHINKVDMPESRWIVTASERYLNISHIDTKTLPRDPIEKEIDTAVAYQIGHQTSLTVSINKVDLKRSIVNAFVEDIRMVMRDIYPRKYRNHKITNAITSDRFIKAVLDDDKLQDKLVALFQYVNGWDAKKDDLRDKTNGHRKNFLEIMKKITEGYVDAK